jgi:hypothetical protein
MKLSHLSRHAYAPELNEAVFVKHGKEYRFRVPGVTRLSDVRRKLFNFKRGLLATVSKRYPDQPQLNRTVSGFVSNRVEAITVARAWIAKLAPGGEVNISIQIRG